MCTSLPKGLKKAKGARLKEFLQSTPQAIKCTYEQGMMVVSVRSFPKSTSGYPVPWPSKVQVYLPALPVQGVTWPTFT